ncbi:hypothetical protein PCANB_001335 [Pneumocystis canis]|nr:hypothetical protein PCANB_001335 [Pneumocystis canis]
MKTLMTIFIPLYRSILRAHRKYLPPDARFLGNKYVQQEFRLHKNIKNPIHLIGFIDSWKNYLKDVENCAWKEYKLESIKLNKMTDDQLYQLYELIQAIKERKIEKKSIFNDP